MHIEDLDGNYPVSFGGAGTPPKTFANREVGDERTWTYSQRVLGGVPALPKRRSRTNPHKPTQQLLKNEYSFLSYETGTTFKRTCHTEQRIGQSGLNLTMLCSTLEGKGV